MRKEILLIIVLSFLLGGVTFSQEIDLSSPGLTPDSPFYFLDTLGERAGLFFAFGAEKKAAKALKYAEEKLAEVKAMAEKNKTKAVEIASQNYQEFLNIANQKTKEAKDKGKDIEKLAVLITETTLKHQGILIEVFEKAPEEVKTAIEKAIEISRSGFEEAVQAVTGAKKEELEQKIEEVLIIANWKTYINEKYGYSFKYPLDCFYGAMLPYCKQSPPEERPLECLCFLNGKNPDEVMLQAFIGEKDKFGELVLADFSVDHYDTVYYNLSPDTDLVEWLKEKFSYQDIPDEINTEIDGIPAVKVHFPGSPMAFSMDNIYFIKNDKLFRINMLNVNSQSNKKLYDQILSTFKFTELEEVEKEASEEKKEVCPLPEVPVLEIEPSSPVDSGMVYTINWSTVSEATGYTVQRDTALTFSNPSRIYNGSLNSVKEWHSPDKSTLYHYKVRAENSCGDSHWSNIVGMWVEVATVPETPVLTDPGISVDKHEAFTLNWTSVSETNWYALQRGTSTNFSTPPWICEVNSNTDNPGIGTSAPEVTTTYYYRVKACNEHGCGYYSNIVDMQVIVPSTITVSSPNGGEEWTVGQIYDITWQAEGIQDNFEIYLRDDRADSTYELIVTELSPSLRTYSWIISSDIISWINGSGDMFKIQVRELGGKAGGGPGEGIFDESDDYFSIELSLLGNIW